MTRQEIEQLEDKIINPVTSINFIIEQLDIDNTDRIRVKEHTQRIVNYIRGLYETDS